jgi:Tol biopolymer transport system component
MTLTAKGVIVGTPQYMAPEQINGRTADARTDIFAFGVLIYEMIAGRKAFEGKTQAEVMAAILERDPIALSSLQSGLSSSVDAVVSRCMARDPGERWQSAGDLATALRLLLEPAIADPQELRSDTVQAGRWRRRHKMWAAMVTLLGATTIVFVTFRSQAHESPIEPRPVRFTVPTTDSATFEGSARPVQPAGAVISPDGQKLAYTAADSTGTVRLWVRPFDSLVAQPLVQTEGASLPFWSPDSRWLGFFSQAKLKKINVSGGPPQTLCNVGEAWGGTWNRTATIVFATGRGLSRVSSAGGEAVTITTPTSNHYRFPSFLPDGRHLLYYVSAVSPGAMLPPPDANTGVHVRSLDSPDDRRLLESDSAGVYAPPGYVLFVRQGTLLAQPFDAHQFQLNGAVVPLAESVPFERNAPAFSVSDNGVLTYRTGPADQNSQLAWFDRSGKLIETVGAAGSYRGIDLSPDGKRIAVHRHDGGGGDAWVIEPRGSLTRLTFDPSQDNSSPIWSPEGDRIAFGSLRSGKWGLYLKHSDGMGAEELLVESVLPKSPMAWSPDGKSIIYFVADPKTGRDQWMIPISGDRKPVALLNSSFSEDHPQISPDGKWIAYASAETEVSGVYVKPFPSGDGRWPVSPGRGLWPRWRGDGKEIFYLNGSKLMAASVTTGRKRFEVGTAIELFDSRIISPLHVTELNVYAVSRDGQRFLIPVPVSNYQGVAVPAGITVTLNWASVVENGKR